MRKYLKILFVLILAIALIGTLVACKDEEPNGGNGGNENKAVQDIDFMSAVNKSSDNNISIIVISDKETIWSYVNGKVNNKYDLDINKANFTTATDAMNYSTSDFTDSKIEEVDALGVATYSANIANAKEFLGIDGDISNAKIEITIDKATKAFNKNKITYNITQDGYKFSVEITIASKN